MFNPSSLPYFLKESIEDIRIRVPKGNKAKVQEHAANMGKSMNSFVVRAIDEAMERDNTQSPTPSSAPSPSAASINNPPALESASPKKYNKHLTKTEADQINLQELLTNIKYQLDIVDAYGTEVLSSLLEQARQQATENKIPDA